MSSTYDASAKSNSKTTTSSTETEWATIGDIARDFDVTLRTLRFYESRGLLSPRREGMNRFYSEQDRNRLALILKGKKLGFTLTEIRVMVAQNSENKNGLKLSLPQIDDQLTMLRSQLVECQSAIGELEERRAAFI